MSGRMQERAMEGGRAAGLSREQKAKVCQMAQRAWERQGRPYWADQEGVPEALRLSKSLALETWRQEEQDHVAGKRSLKECGQGEFCLLMAHFSQLAGEWDEAAYWGERASGDGKRRAMWALKREAEKAEGALGNPERYAAAIAEDKFGTADPERLSEKQIWTLVFDLRRAAARKGRRAGGRVRLPGGAAGGEEWSPGGR